MSLKRQHDAHDGLAMLPWYPRDWRASESRAVLSPLARGLYRELLDAAWLSEDCSLPDDDRRLAALAGVDGKTWAKVSAEVRACFVAEDGRLSQGRLSWQHEKANTLRSKQRDSAAAANAQRAAHRARTPRGDCGGDRPDNRNGDRGGDRTQPTPEPTPTPEPLTDQRINHPLRGAGGLAERAARPPAPLRGAEDLDHDPANPVEHQVAERCVELARLVADGEGREPVVGDADDVLEAISGTRDGKSLETIRGAPHAWLGATLAASRRFEQDHTAPREGAGR